MAIVFETALLYLEPGDAPGEGDCIAPVHGEPCGAKAQTVRTGRPVTLQMRGAFLLPDRLPVPLCGRHGRRHPRQIEAVVGVVCAQKGETR